MKMLITQAMLIDFFKRIGIWEDTRAKLNGLANGDLISEAWATTDEGAGNLILRALRGEARGEDHEGTLQVGTALAELCLSDDQWSRARLDALGLVLEQTWGTQGFIDVLRDRLQDAARRPAVLNFFRVLVDESNADPEFGFLGHDEERQHALRLAWERTDDIQTLLAPRADWNQEPYLNWLWQIVADLVLDAPEELSALLDELLYPWVLSAAIAHLPREHETAALLTLLERARCCTRPNGDGSATWNRALLAPLSLAAVWMSAVRDWEEASSQTCPHAVMTMLSQAIQILLVRPDHVFLVFQSGVALVSRLTELDWVGETSRLARLAEVWSQLVTDGLAQHNLGDRFYQEGVIKANPQVSVEAKLDFVETGRLAKAHNPNRLDALVTLAAWLSDADLTLARTEKIVALYEHQLSAGRGVFPSLVRGQAFPTEGHFAIAHLYSRLDKPLSAWQQTEILLSGARYRMAHEPFGDQSHELRCVEAYHLWVGIALDDLLFEPGGDRNEGFLIHGLERVKHRLIALEDLPASADLYRALALHLATRLFLQRTAKATAGVEPTQVAHDLLTAMAAVPSTALGILDMLASNGLEVEAIRADRNCLACVHALVAADEWRAKLDRGARRLVSRVMAELSQKR